MRILSPFAAYALSSCTFDKTISLLYCNCTVTYVTSGICSHASIINVILYSFEMSSTFLEGEFVSRMCCDVTNIEPFVKPFSNIFHTICNMFLSWMESNVLPDVLIFDKIHGLVDV